MRITGTVKYLDFEGGFWGIISEDKQYLPLNFPEQLKINERVISCNIIILEDISTMVSWGIPVKISSFKTFT